MNAKQANNLRVLADHIDAKGADLDLFNFGCCAFSAALEVPELVRQGLQRLGAGIGMPEYYTSFHVAQHLFGVSDMESWRLFALGSASLPQHCTAAQWATEARRVLAAHGYGPQSSEDWAKEKVAYVINSQDALIGTDKRDLLVAK